MLSLPVFDNLAKVTISVNSIYLQDKEWVLDALSVCLPKLAKRGILYKRLSYTTTSIGIMRTWLGKDIGSRGVLHMMI